MKICGRCKSKDLIKEITFRWYQIGEKWELDTTDHELTGEN
jgi:hypothetical protein